MKKFLTALLCVISLTMALFAFTACSNKQTYNCVGYDFTADDGEEMDMLNMLNSLTLVFAKETINGKQGTSVVTFEKA